MKTLISQLQIILGVTFFSIIMSCEQALMPASGPEDILFVEETFAAAEELYRKGGAGNFDLAVEKLKLVLRYDAQNCFEDAYFYLADIYLAQNNREKARNILSRGKARYKRFRGRGCTAAIIRRFDAYLERMSPESKAGPSIFVAFDKRPFPVGGLKEIQRNLEYPKDAIDKGIEGKVIVNILVDCFGHPCKTRISSGGQMQSMDIAARKAVKSVKWKPATQQRRPVKVWVSVPVVFKLK
jgi:protein TonB